MAKKKITLYCFDIEPAVKMISVEQNLLQDIINILNSVTGIQDKMRTISDIDSDSESEFIASTTSYNNGIFCCFIKMKKGAAANISAKLLAMKEFKLEDTTKEDNAEISGHIKDYTYFFLTDKYLILKSGHIKFIEIETYLNWLLKKNTKKYEKDNSVLTLSAHIDKNYDLSKIKTIELTNGAKISKEQTVAAVITDIVKGLKEKLQEAQPFENIDPNDILSAIISFKLKNHSKKSKKDNEKLLQHLIRLFRDDAIFKDKNNSTIQLETVKKKTEIYVYYTGDYPDSSELANKMQNFINEIE